MCKAGKLREEEFYKAANPRGDDKDLKAFMCKKGHWE